MWLS
jgi:hypothetical protein